MPYFVVAIFGYRFYNTIKNLLAKQAASNEHLALIINQHLQLVCVIPNNAVLN